MKRTLLFAIFFFIILPAHAQIVRVLNLKYGLSNNYVQCILQDKQGYIWIGTRDGLNRYNGYQIEVFKEQLLSTFIYSLMQDSGGRIWIGTSGGGISIYDPEKEQFEDLSKIGKSFSTLSNKDIYTIYEDSDHDIWLGTLQGLAFIKHSMDTVIWYQQRLAGSDHSFTSIHEDKQHNLLLGTNKGIFQIRKSENILSPQPYLPLHDLNGLFIRDIVEDASGNLWIATDEKGIFKFNADKKTINNFSTLSRDKLKSDQIWKLYVDNRGILWAALINGGLYRYDSITETFWNYQQKISSVLNSKSITGILEDFNGNIWVTSHGDGACYFNPNKYVFEKYLGGEPQQAFGRADIVSSFFEDDDGAIWIGTDGDGLKKITEKNIVLNSLSTKVGLSSNIILDIIEDDKKGKWLATWQGGVNYIDRTGKKIKVFNERNAGIYGLQTPNVKALMKDTLSNIWMVTHGKGVAIYNTDKGAFIDPLTVTSAYRPEIAQWGSDILQTRKGDVWIASHAGLFRYSGNTVQQYHTTGENPLSSSLIYCLYEDSDGGIWIGTNRSLEKYLPEKNGFENYSIKYGIPGDIKCILEDTKHHLWISTINEIIEFDPAAKSIRHFDLNYNTQQGQFYECACLKSKKGKLFFGGTEGFNAFYPDSLKDNLFSSKLIITNLYLFNKKQKPGDKGSVINTAMPYTRSLTLTHAQNVVSFEFMALNYTSFNKNFYSYKMEGFDEDWSPISESRMATYTNLDPGFYQFKVRSVSLNHAVLNETMVNIKIVPPFWKTGWFRYLVLFLLIVSIIGFFLLRLQSSRKKRLVLQQLVAERTDQLQKSNASLKDLNTTKDRLFSIIAHDLRNPFTSLLGISRLLNTDYDRYTVYEKRKLIRSLYHSSASVYSLLENLLVWSKSQQRVLVFSPEKLYFKTLVTEHFDLIKDEAEKKSITLILSDQNEISFIADRNMLSIILRNLLSNALKYSPPKGKIEVDYKLESNGLEIFIKDEGIGIEKGIQLFEVSSDDNRHRDHNHGLGLILCREFVEKHGGHILASNNALGGALFSFTLPLSNPERIEEKFGHTLFNGHQNVTPHDQSLANKSGNVPTVLVAEDDDEIRWYIKQILFPDFQVVEAINGHDAEILSLEKNPDIILSDLVMPKMDGLEFCNKIKSHPQTSHIPFIMLTAERSNEKKISGYQYGADDYITKPIEPNVLRARLHNIIENRKRLMAIYQKDITAAPEAFTTNTVDQDFLEKLNHIIEDQITNPDLNPDTLARDVNMSRTGLYMKVKALTGESVGIYIRNVRLKESKKILLERKLNISEVAYAVGFNQLPYFTTCFKEAFGITPTEFLGGKGK